MKTSEANLSLVTVRTCNVHLVAFGSLTISNMVEVKKQQKETIGSMLRRFSERIKKSGILNEAKEARWYKKPKTKRERREAAITKVQRQAAYKIKTRRGF